MLVHRKVGFSGGYALMTTENFVIRIILCVFGSLPQDRKVPFVQERSALNGRQFFCCEHQFIVEVEEFDYRIEFRPHWHCGEEEARKKEQAIATLFEHCFVQVGKVISY